MTTTVNFTEVVESSSCPQPFKSQDNKSSTGDISEDDYYSSNSSGVSYEEWIKKQSDPFTRCDAWTGF